MEHTTAIPAESVDPDLCHPYRDLAAAYQAWEALDAGRAWPPMRAAVAALEREPAHPLAAHLEQLRFQERVLARLQPLSQGEEPPEGQVMGDLQLVIDLAFSLYHAGQRAAAAGSHNLAALLQYRLLELLVQRRLARHGLSTSAPDYSAVAIPDLAETLVALRADLLQQVDGRPELPAQIGLASGLLLLQALGDPLAAAIDWPLLGECLATRNRSILVHGYLWLGEAHARAFERLLEPVLDRFCQAEGLDCRAQAAAYRFVET